MNNKLKKIIKIDIFLILLMILCSSSLQTNASIKKNNQDVKALNKIISTQKKRGAKVSTDIDNQKQYRWDKKTGRLSSLIWNRKKIKGKIDISSFKGLKNVYLKKNKITNIKLGKLNKLKRLWISYNKLKRINTTKIKNLKDFDCDNNNINKLNISKNVNLKILGCAHNKLTKLNLKKSKKLAMLDCGYNKLKEIDASNCKLYWGLACQNNNLKTIRLKHKSSLSFLFCQNNLLKSLNLDDIYSIQEIKCQNNRLKEIDLTRTDQDELYKFTCDKNVEIIGIDKRNVVETKTIKKNVAFYEFDLINSIYCK